MIILLKKDADKKGVLKLEEELKEKGFLLNVSEGSFSTILGLIGDVSTLDIDIIKANSVVDSVKRISEPFKRANRKFHPDETIVDVGGTLIGGENFCVMAGPCSVENEKQIIDIAKSVKKSGANLLRGGAFKPRTSPYAFQGLEAEGIKLLLKAKEEANIPIVTEIMDLSQLEFFENVDMIQVGARNMQNFRLLKELGKTKKPILLKRGLANTMEEFLMSAEYIMANGNENVVLCERGIRTFETYTRNTLDISAVPVLKRMTHLPVVVDPSHAGGHAYLVPSLSMAAIASGAAGLMIEVHNDPAKALSDGAQSITPVEFDKLAKKLFALKKFIKTIED